MDVKWIPKEPLHTSCVASLAEELKVDTFIAQILCNRGITNFNEAKKFFRPSLDDLHDPFLMEDMEKAVKRLDQAIQNNEKILIFGDYDVDGTTSAALMYQFLKQFTDKLEYYIPDRFKEGYGISKASIDYASTNGFGLVIALDCGISSVELIEQANSLELDYIICDHHLPGQIIPNAVAVLNPKRNDCGYPYKELCGCGVGFKLAQAYCIFKDIDLQMVYQYLDLVAIAIGADIVPIDGENRTLCYFGMQQIKEQPRVGIQAMVLNFAKPELETISDVVFRIAPRINAAGRMKSGNMAVELLVETDKEKAIHFAEQIESENSTRKELDSQTTDDAIQELEEDPNNERRSSTVVCREGWHKGVVGIVASRLIERYYRPTIVLCEKDGIITGSARSVGSFNIHEAISKCSDLLENFGGHTMAAGLTLKKENLEAFKERFEKAVKESIRDEDLIPVLNYECEITLDQITPKNLQIIEQMRPFGPKNRTPKFVSKQLENDGSRLLKDGHIKTTLRQGNTKISGIGFKLGEDTYTKIKKQPVDVCYKIEWNEFRGIKSIQMMVLSVK